jgi:DNA-binding CsgD family transcriptional regulator
VLNRIGDAVGRPRVTCVAYDQAANLAYMSAPRIDPDTVRVYVERWAALSPLRQHTRRVPPGKVFVPTDFMPLDEFTATAFFQEWWRPAGLGTEPLTTNLLVDGSVSGLLACYAMPGGPPCDSDQRRSFAAIVPHAVRAFALHRRLHDLAIANEAGVHGLDHLQQGFLLVDAQARVLFANGAGRAMLDARDGLQLDDCALSAIDGDGDRTLARLIASCAGNGGTTAERGGEVSLVRHLRPPLQAVVTPLSDATVAAYLPWIATLRPAAIVLVSDPEMELRTRVMRHCRRFGLTAAETAFALEIVKGHGRRAAAEQLGISVSTARSHLSSIFHKTGTHRQAELVRLLLRPS